MMILISGLIGTAVYLAWGPLPVVRWPAHILQLRTTVKYRLRSWRKSQAPSPVPFLWTLHSEVMAGSLMDVALLRACAVMPPRSLANTHAALVGRKDVALALEADSKDARLEILADVAMVYRICARTGAPITESLMRIISSVRNEQMRQRTMAQETASTNATVVVLAALPLLGVLMGLGLGMNPLAWLLHSFLGFLCLVAGLTLEILGWLWVRLLMRRAGAST